jgi:hypothetical protein
MVTLRARFDGKVLVPEGPVDLPIGQILELSVTRPESEARSSPAAIAEVLRSLEPIGREEKEEFERLIQEGKVPVNYQGVFDEDER